MPRELQASSTNIMGPNYSYEVRRNSSNQIEVVLREGPDTLALRFDSREQAHEVLRDIILQVNSLGNNLPT